MTIWRSLLLVYPKIDVRLGGMFAPRFAHEMPAAQINDGVDAFRCFPALVSDLTDSRAGIEYEIVTCERTLTKLSSWGKPPMWWPSPDNVQLEMKEQGVADKYDSVFVFWPRSNLAQGRSIPSAGWGLGSGASAASMGATYATVANIQTGAWQIPLPGEVWLHEWLHGVCAHFAKRGVRLPDGDADGADRHGYVRSPTTGWTEYYRDLMQGRVLEDGQLTGIPLAAWRDPLPRTRPIPTPCA